MNCRSTDRPKRKRPPFSPCGTPEFRTPVVDSRRKQSNFISYRDSTLTWILKESLGGNSVTAMLATVSPSSLHIDDTLATLQYVKRAQCIVNNAVVNEDPEGRIIRELMSEIERLRQCLNAAEAPHSPLATQVQTLKKLLLAREEEVNFLTTELTKRTVDCERLQVAISQVTPFGTPKRLVNFLDDSDDNGNTPVIPSKRLKSDSCSTNSGTSDSPGDDRLAPDGADHYPIHEWTKNEATVLTQKIESAVQTEGVNEVNTNNAQIFGCHTGIISNNQTDPQSLALSYRKCGICSWEPVRKIDASSNTCDVDLGCGLISQRGLEYTDLELHVVGKPLNVLLDVKKKDVSIGVSENASDLSVLPIQELSLMREVINHSSEAMFSEAGINTIEEVEVLPKQIFLEMKQKILLLESTLATYTCKVKHEVGTSSDDHDCRIPFEKSSKQSTEETHNTTKGFAVFKGKKLVDSSVLTNDTELDVTYMSVNLFNRLYERLHNLRMRVDVLESKTTSDANVATDEDIQVLQAGADGFLTRMDEPSPVLTRYKRGLSDNKKMGNNVEVCVNMKNRLEKMTEHLTEPGHTLDKEVKMVDVSTLTNDIIESTCINEVSEDAAASPIVLGDGEKSVRSRVDFFEKLKQDNALATSGRALLGSKEVSVVSVKPKKVPVDSTINEVN
uniref:Kinesin-like protein n=3 Tax=Mesocestoides corti TaxID=53468 RepID=A0A5K3FL83_MESCO